MNTFDLLQKELKYYGVASIDNNTFKIKLPDGQLQDKNIIEIVKELNIEIKDQKKNMLFLWTEIEKLLSQNKKNNINNIQDLRIIDLFLFSLRDLYKFISCFNQSAKSKFANIILNSLKRDISDFDKNQISQLIDYKIAIDWTHRTIHRLLYMRKLLIFATMDRQKIDQYTVKTARGVSGPWANLDLPFFERVFPFEDQEIDEISTDKQKQRRYRNNMREFNQDGRVAEGFYWRELRNEPYSWENRSFDSPYPKPPTPMRP